MQLATFFHSTGCTANLLPRSIYGSKQDADGGREAALPYVPSFTRGVWTEVVGAAGTHRGYEELLDLLHRSPHLDLRSGLRIFHCDQDVKVFV